MNEILEYEKAYKQLSDEQSIIQLKHDHEWAIFYNKIKKIYNELGNDSLTKIMLDHHKYTALNKVNKYKCNGYESISQQISLELSAMENDIDRNIEVYYKNNLSESKDAQQIF